MLGLHLMVEGPQTVRASEGVGQMRSATPLIALCLILAGCGGSGASSTTGPALSVTIPSGPIYSGKSVQASASITNGSGGSSPATDVTWTSSNGLVASVSSSGLITGARQGNATIRARSGSLTGEVSVIVHSAAEAERHLCGQWASGHQRGTAPGSTMHECEGRRWKSDNRGRGYIRSGDRWWSACRSHQPAD